MLRYIKARILLWSFKHGHQYVYVDDNLVVVPGGRSYRRMYMRLGRDKKYYTNYWKIDDQNLPVKLIDRRYIA